MTANIFLLATLVVGGTPRKITNNVRPCISPTSFGFTNGLLSFTFLIDMLRGALGHFAGFHEVRRAAVIYFLRLKNIYM